MSDLAMTATLIDADTIGVGYSCPCGCTPAVTGGVGVKPGQTKELTYTFTAPGQTLAGCHVDGHYGLGMKATITVSG